MVATHPTQPRPNEGGFAANGLRKRGPDRAPAILGRRARDSVAARAARAAGDAGSADHRDPATGRRGLRQPPAGDLPRRHAPAALTRARATPSPGTPAPHSPPHPPAPPHPQPPAPTPPP